MRNLFRVGGSIASKEYIRHDALAVDCYFKATNFHSMAGWQLCNFSTATTFIGYCSGLSPNISVDLGCDLMTSCCVAMSKQELRGNVKTRISLPTIGWATWLCT
jgi:hypothetical protein